MIESICLWILVIFAHIVPYIDKPHRRLLYDVSTLSPTDLSTKSVFPNILSKNRPNQLNIPTELVSGRAIATHTSNIVACWFLHKVQNINHNIFGKSWNKTVAIADSHVDNDKNDPSWRLSSDQTWLSDCDVWQMLAWSVFSLFTLFVLSGQLCSVLLFVCDETNYFVHGLFLHHRCSKVQPRNVIW